MLYNDFSVNVSLYVIGTGSSVYKLPEYDDLILNVPFGDLRGRSVAEDACCTNAPLVNWAIADRREWYFNGSDHSSNNTTATGYMGGF